MVEVGLVGVAKAAGLEGWKARQECGGWIDRVERLESGGVWGGLAQTKDGVYLFQDRKSGTALTSRESGRGKWYLLVLSYHTDNAALLSI
jgi:hypothetical protein